MAERKLPDCWGHRGASAAFPENTLASFEAAIRDGAEGIESDVHVSLDGVVLMFHDPALDRTTDSTGYIKNRNWCGPDGMEHVRTKKEPKQSIPTFAETVALLMLPENQHVKFDIDVKPQNDPPRLFTLLRDILSAIPDWETRLAPRLILGLWHPAFVGPAKAILPLCRRSYIGNSIAIAKDYFWRDCDTFSIAFGSLVGARGEEFRKQCKAAGKKVMVWTVNEADHMMEAVRWEVDVILTDRTKFWLEMRDSLAKDYENVLAKQSRIFLWTSWRFYLPVNVALGQLLKLYLEKIAGSFDVPLTMEMSPSAVAATA
ncbi:PLC-like phosphodiesterase [Fistulina hepatica ATCC 64428]|uniref:PLC-like phosphodiesterase n=1 Tax=Fistulina hepatica ATCC 64428 TaxID=1128425 RepID=A0A0D7AIT0_9AGAR|nr:PLC-like phosphodiesterase [Fistulina hepatica ATCC 64428]